MQINGRIEFTITEKTPDRVDAEMPIQDSPRQVDKHRPNNGNG
jgi:hypothetical protein